MKVFLSAEWHNLINLTYRVPAEKLEPLLPKGVELDLYEGHAHLSLVAFDFINTRQDRALPPEQGARGVAGGQA